MSTDAMEVAGPESEVPGLAGMVEAARPSSPAHHDNAPKVDPSDSELSDIEEPEEDIGDVFPVAIEDGVPVFRPPMCQFQKFELYVKKLNKYGMETGIVKVIPPQEWLDNQPALDEAVKTIKIKEPIKQEIAGSAGKYRQLNVLHQRSYNLPQWRQLCDQSEHQPPAKRGERRANQDKAPRPTPRSKGTSTPTSSNSKKKGLGRSSKNKAVASAAEEEESTAEAGFAEGTSVDRPTAESAPDRLPTPVSPLPKPEEDLESVHDEADDEDEILVKRRMGGMKPSKVQSVSSRRKHSRREAAGKIDEAAFKDFKYELQGEEFSKERCDYLEEKYWKTLTYASPYYGADMLGTLFDDQTKDWNLGKLQNILDVLGEKVPGVNTAYLYLGMWKATFAWHLEDVDLYSINYLHFGAPKQWYSISQKDARKFEGAMKSIWQEDAKNCDQFLRHKTFLISPSTLLNSHGVKVNKIVHRPGEFIITFPYGYHSGYNLGYNCAEAVNFGLYSWLEYGRIAKKCDCSQAQDSVWIDVREIERKLRGEETDYELTEDDEEDEDDDRPTDLPTPPESSGDTKPRRLHRKRKRVDDDKSGTNSGKRIRLRIQYKQYKQPCALCPNDIHSEDLLPTDDGRKVHRMCAEYIPETEIELGPSVEVTGVSKIQKARMELKCNYCKSKVGACFQCSQKKCTRAYHPTCAAAAGVFVEQGEVPLFGPDGTEYKVNGIEFSCRFHRAKRDKKVDGAELGEDARLLRTASEISLGKTIQWRPYGGEIYAGKVVENNKSEETFLINVLPRGGLIEVDYRWLVLPEPSDYHLQKPSANAIPMPKSAKVNTSQRHQDDDVPRPDDIFAPGFVWKTFESYKPERNTAQVAIDLNKENQIWYYLGKTSTEAKAQFTEDLAFPRHNPKGHFLDTIPKPIPAVLKMQPRHSFSASFPYGVNQNAINAARAAPRQVLPPSISKPEKPYEYKPRDGLNNVSIPGYRHDIQTFRTSQGYGQHPTTAWSFGSDPKFASRSADDHSSTTSLTYGHSETAYSPSPVGLLTPHVAPQPRSLSNAPQRMPANPFRRPPNPIQSPNDVFKKYYYLQREHNRSPLDYKSPYSQSGGFMNGYEGNLKEHLRQNPDALFRRGTNNASSIGPGSSNPQQYAQKQSYVPPPQTYSSRPSYPATVPQNYSLPPATANHNQSPSRQYVNPEANGWEKKDSSQLHPAIRPNYGNGTLFHHQYQPQNRPEPPAKRTQTHTTSPLTQQFSGQQHHTAGPIMPSQCEGQAQQPQAPRSQILDHNSYHISQNRQQLSITPTQYQALPPHVASPHQASQLTTTNDNVAQTGITCHFCKKPNFASTQCLREHQTRKNRSGNVPCPVLKQRKFEEDAKVQLQLSTASTVVARSQALQSAIPQNHAIQSSVPLPQENIPQAKPQQTVQAQAVYQKPYQPMLHQDNKPLYVHQQYFQKTAPQTHELFQETREVPDVPADYTTVVEQIHASLRRVSVDRK